MHAENPGSPFLSRQNSLYNIMGSINGLPAARQSNYNRASNASASKFEYKGFDSPSQTNHFANWWEQLPGDTPSPSLGGQNISPQQNQAPTQSNQSASEQNPVAPQPSKIVKPAKKIAPKHENQHSIATRRMTDEVAEPHKKPSNEAKEVAKPHEAPNQIKRMAENSDDAQDRRAPSSPNAIRKMSDSSGGGDLAPDVAEIIPLVNLDQKSPPVWTVGTILVFLIVYGCSIAQAGGFASFSTNPLIGADSSTLLLLGAKYGPFILNGEFWRFLTAIWLHSGAVHLVISLAIIISTMSVEKDSGFVRSFIVFILAGVYGYILSSLLIPETISCGATGSLFGFLGIQLVDLINSWRSHQHPVRTLIIIIVAIIVTIVLGLTPYLDNFTHFGGLVMGILFGLMILPNFTFDKCEIICHGFTAFFAFPAMTVIFMISLVVFFRRIDSSSSTCSWCYELDCVNISGWCTSANESASTYEKVYYLS